MKLLYFQNINAKQSCQIQYYRLYSDSVCQKKLYPLKFKLSASYIGGFHSILLRRTTLGDQLYTYRRFVPRKREQISSNCTYVQYQALGQ